MPKQSHATSNETSILLIKPHSGEPVRLTAPALEQWFAHTEMAIQKKFAAEAANTNTTELATQLLSRYGLQSARDVIKFLESPAGEITKAMIGARLAEIDALEEHVRQEMLADQLLREYSLAFLLLGLLDRREAQAENLNEEIQAANEKRAHLAEQDAIQRRQAAAASLPHGEQTKLLYTYTSSYKAIEQALNTKLQESSVLEKALEDVEIAMVQAAFKYAEYGVELSLAYQDLALLGPLLSIPIPTLQDQIYKLTQRMSSDHDTIAALLESGEEEEARRRMEVSNARNLHVAVLQDMLDVVAGTKHLFKLDGTPTDNFNEADFILPLQKKIVLDSGVYYLLDVNEDAASLSAEKRDASHRAYLRQRPDIMGVQQLVEHNKQLEQQAHTERQARLSAQSELMQQEIKLLAQQLTRMQSARATVEAMMSTPTAPNATLRPVPAPSNSAKASSVQANSTPSLSQSYSHMLKLMRSRPSERALDWLKGLMTDPSVPQQLKRQVTQLKPGQPIPEQLMKSLLSRKELGSTWLSRSTPDVIKTRFTPFQRPTPEPEAAPSTAPNPFSLKPPM